MGMKEGRTRCFFCGVLVCCLVWVSIGGGIGLDGPDCHRPAALGDSLCGRMSIIPVDLFEGTLHITSGLRTEGWWLAGHTHHPYIIPINNCIVLYLQPVRLITVLSRKQLSG